MGINSMAIKGLLNPMLQEKARLTYEEKNSISEYWVLVIPFLRLFFQGIIDDDKSKDFLKALVRCNKKEFREIVNLLIIWFFYNLDRLVIRGVNDLLEDERLKRYLLKVWYVDSIESNEIIYSLDNARIEERQRIFCEFLCNKLNDKNLLTTLMIFVSPHMFGNLKSVLTLKQDDLIKLG